MPKQRNWREDKAPNKTGNSPTEWEGQPDKRRQQATAARWTKKHGASHYGYKNHVNVDKTHKLIGQYAVTEAAVHARQVLKAVLLPAEAGRDIWADSAYQAEAIETQLKAKRLRAKIHYTPPTAAEPSRLNRPLTIEAVRVCAPVANMLLVTRAPR